MKNVFMTAVLASFAHSVSLDKILAQVQDGTSEVEAAFSLLEDESITPY